MGKNELKAEMREMELRLNSEMKLMRGMIGLSLAMSTGIMALLATLFFYPAALIYCQR